MKIQSLSIALACIALSACSGGAGPGGGPQEEATLTVAITDAPVDDLESFVVDITAIQLTKVGGATVGALPATATLDLVSLTEVSQVLNVLNVPPGLYNQASVTIDFTNASASLVGSGSPAAILDGDGVPLNGPVTLPITIGNMLNAVAGAHKILELDFDLNQSVTVDTLANEVAMEPVIVMRVDRSDPKEFGAGGALQAVDLFAGSMAIELQTLSGVPLHQVDVFADASTLYQIDGVPLMGAAGLAAVSLMPSGSWIQGYGTVELLSGRIDATYIEAGAGTYNGGTDIVEGHIVARQGGPGVDPVLTVLGHSNDASHTSFQFNTLFTVHADFGDTKVVRRKSPSAYDTDDLNVGQRVRLFGDLVGQVLDVTDAAHVIRMQPTRLFGYANAAPAGGVLDLDLSRVDARVQAAFSWGDGGTTPADPDALLVGVGNLGDGLGIGPGSAVEAIGFFPAIDDGGDDFGASSLVNRDAAPSLMAIHNRAAGFQVHPTATAQAITLDIVGAPGFFEFAVIDKGFVGVTPLPDTPTPSIEPAGPFGLYFLRDRVTGAVTLDLGFAAFSSKLDGFVGLGAPIYDLGALGQYDAGANRIDASLVVISVN